MNRILWLLLLILCLPGCGAKNTTEKGKQDVQQLELNPDAKLEPRQLKAKF